MVFITPNTLFMSLLSYITSLWVNYMIYTGIGYYVSFVQKRNRLNSKGVRVTVRNYVFHDYNRF